MAENGAPTIVKGLEGIYFTETKICKVDGAKGRLWYRGYSIESLAKNSSFEETSYLILYGSLPNADQLEQFSKKLVSYMSIDKSIVDLVSSFSGKMPPMDILRSAVSALPAFSEKKVYQNESDEKLEQAIEIIGRICGLVGVMGMLSKNGKYFGPDPSLGVAANILYMMDGTKPEEKAAKMLDVMMILHAEHSSNASTFCTLVAGSTLADLFSAITAGICALKGPLHGGADEKALEMMKAIGTPDNTEKYIDEALDGKKRIMGFGHRVYKAYDPRAKVIKTYLEEIQNGSTMEVQVLTSIALRAEKMMVEKLGETKGIWPNVDFFSGPVYTYIGIPKELFTPLFAASRSPGWCAHMLEYWQDNRLIRPLDYYNGQIDIPYVSVEQRK